MKVKTSTGSYRYPDVLVICDNDFIDDGNVSQTPVIIVDVTVYRKSDDWRCRHYCLDDEINFE
jgi:Uma2 family endonuclease